ncbi:MAG: hypothetical protein LBU19_02895 [Treponema sp.]|nr:hypothetical protein [Treponema sp.]
MRSLTLFLVSLFFLAPDGAGGGGPSGGAALEGWIKRLNEAGKTERKSIVEEMARALGLKTGDAYKLLKEAGWDPKAGSGADGDPPSPPDPPPEKTFSVTLRHTSPYPHYRRAGLLLTGQFKPYTVTEEQRAALKQDAWVEFQTPKGPDKT